jgi:hypothetical protein
LGWKIQRATTEGTVLEKDGKVATLVSETAAISPWDETVTDISCLRPPRGLHRRPFPARSLTPECRQQEFRQRESYVVRFREFARLLENANSGTSSGRI